MVCHPLEPAVGLDILSRATSGANSRTSLCSVSVVARFQRLEVMPQTVPNLRAVIELLGGESPVARPARELSPQLLTAD